MPGYDLNLEDMADVLYKCLKCNIISTNKTHRIKQCEHVFDPLYDCKICATILESELDFKEHYYKNHSENGTTTIRSQI